MKSIKMWEQSAAAGTDHHDQLNYNQHGLCNN